jgi:hypothetical protein
MGMYKAGECMPTLTERFTQAMQYLSPGYYVGLAAQALANSEISTTSMRLLEQRGGLVTSSTPRPEEVLRGDNIVLNMAQAFGNAASTSPVIMAAGGNPLGLAISFGKAGGEVQDAHKKLIEDCANKGIPGYRHETVEINGRPVEIWVDGTNTLDGESSGARYASIDIHNPGLMKPQEPDTQAQIKLNMALDRLESQAIEDLHRYNQTEPFAQYAANLLASDLAIVADNSAPVGTGTMDKKAIALASGPGS